MDELDGGGSCTGGSIRIGPSVPIGSGQGRSVVTSYTPPRPPQLRHMLCSPMGTASSLSRGRILKGFAPNPSHLLCARHHRMAGPTLENGRAGRRGFLHGWLDQNWALCSHRFWSGKIGRYFVHSAEATAAPTHALLTHGDCIIFIEGPNFERLRPQPIAPALRSAPQNGGPNTRKWTSWTAGVPAC